MKVLSFSYCFPSRLNPTWGVFVLQRLAAMARRLDLQAVCPVLTFPLLKRAGTIPSTETRMGLVVHYPRVFYLPGILQRRHPWFYRRGVGTWLARYVDEHGKPDLLDSHFIWPDGVGVMHLARRFDLPYVVTLRGKLHPCMEDSAMKRQCLEAMQHADAVVSVDEPMAEIARRHGVAPEKVHVIPNGVDKDFFALHDRQHCRQQLGLPMDKKLLVSIGHLKRTKGHDDAVTALAKLPAEVHLVIIGGEVVTGYTGELKALVDRLGVTDRVTLAGRQPYDKIPLYLGAADAGLLASHREGCPNVVLETLASGRPMVVTRVGAVPQIMEDGTDGAIVPVTDPEALAEGCRRVLGADWSPEALRGSPRVKSWGDVARAEIDVFEAVVGRTDRAEAGRA